MGHGFLIHNVIVRSILCETRILHRAHSVANNSQWRIDDEETRLYREFVGSQNKGRSVLYMLIDSVQKAVRYNNVLLPAVITLRKEN